MRNVVYTENLPTFRGEVVCSSPDESFHTVLWEDGVEGVVGHTQVEEFPDIPLHDPALAAAPGIVARLAAQVGGKFLRCGGVDGCRAIHFLRPNGRYSEEWESSPRRTVREILVDDTRPYPWDEAHVMPSRTRPISPRLFDAVWDAAAVTAR